MRLILSALLSLALCASASAGTLPKAKQVCDCGPGCQCNIADNCGCLESLKAKAPVAVPAQSFGAGRQIVLVRTPQGLKAQTCSNCSKCQNCSQARLQKTESVAPEVTSFGAGRPFSLVQTREGLKAQIAPTSPSQYQGGCSGGSCGGGRRGIFRR